MLVTQAVADALDAGGQTAWRDAHGIASHLGIDVKTVHNRTGPNVTDPIPFHSLPPGGRKRFHIREVDEWLLKRG
jgi:hypothetical protein